MVLHVDGHSVLIDDEDFHFLGDRTWRIWNTRKPYLMASSSIYIGRENGKSKTKKYDIFFHKLVMDCPNGLQVDHINGDSLDNRKENLRICTCAQNHFNTTRSKDNTSKFKGVFYEASRKKYRATISIGNKSKLIGRYNTAEEAYEKYCEYGKALRGEFFNPN